MVQVILGNMQVCPGPPIPYLVQPSACWCRIHGVASPVNQDVCQWMEQSNQDWRCRGFRHLSREQKRIIWEGWKLLGWYGDGSVRLGYIS